MFSRFDEQWSPRIVGELNGQEVRIARIEGEFVRHAHPDADELFLVVEGEIVIRFDDGDVTLGEGEFCIVPRGTYHQPIAEREAKILLFEPAATRNTGDAGGDRTVENLHRL